MNFCPICNCNIEKTAPIAYCPSCHTLLGYLWHSDKFVSYGEYVDYFKYWIEDDYESLNKIYNFRTAKYKTIGSEFTSFQLLRWVREGKVSGSIKVLEVGCEPYRSISVDSVIGDLAYRTASVRSVRYMEDLGIKIDFFLTQTEVSYLIDFAKTFLNEPETVEHLYPMIEEDDDLTGKFPYTILQFQKRINSGFSVFEYTEKLQKDKDVPILGGGTYRLEEIHKPVEQQISGECLVYKSAELGALTSRHLEPISLRIIAAYEKKEEFSRKSSILNHQIKEFKSQWWGLKDKISAYLPIFKDYINTLQKLQQEKDQLKRAAETYSLNLNIQQKKGTEPYYTKVFEAFKKLIGSQIWDIISVISVDKNNEIIDKKPVSFSLQQIPILKCQYLPMHLENANGADLFIYPGFLVLHDESVAVIDLKEVKINTKNLSNPFKGFQVDLTTETGLNESYCFEKIELASEFAKSLIEYQKVL